MKKEFYIFRHGETDYNLEKRWQGCGIDTELNATGLEQAQGLVERLADKNLEIIYSSPLKRAFKTAQIAAEGLGLDVEIIANLREASFGKAEGLIKSDIAKIYPDIFEQWYSPDYSIIDVSFPGGESKGEIGERMFAVLEKLLEAPQQVIGLASHGSSIRYLLLHLGTILPHMPNVAIYHVVYENGKWSVE